MHVLKMSTEELKIAVQLLDIAVKSQGLAVAQNAFVLATRFEHALQNPESRVAAVRTGIEVIEEGAAA